ncbi:hypothetical protein VTJ49DRAFT_4401 [Mycothermus thermophilus]|uniref:Ribosomal protein S21 n=1 Tax=Humicola insolens TaxID=85995 RepID=A0ABR3V5H0_HUMIN
MDLRQVVHSVCRSAAAASRPTTLASTMIRPTPTSSLIRAVALYPRNSFTTNNSQQSAAAAAAAAAPSQPEHPSPPLTSARSPQQQASNLPPRPQPIRSNTSFDSASGRKRTGFSPVSWPNSKAGNRIVPSPSAKTATTSPSPSDSVIPDYLPNQIATDMNRSTLGLLTTWDESEFLTRSFGLNSNAKAPMLRLKPSTGRTVHVTDRIDVARSLRLLERMCAQNQVKHSTILARAHERPALKRKRLRRERWRARFKNGFQACVKRVFQLKAQGW